MQALFFDVFRHVKFQSAWSLLNFHLTNNPPILTSYGRFWNKLWGLLRRQNSDWIRFHQPRSTDRILALNILAQHDESFGSPSMLPTSIWRQHLIRLTGMPFWSSWKSLAYRKKSSICSAVCIRTLSAAWDARASSVNGFQWKRASVKDAFWLRMLSTLPWTGFLVAQLLGHNWVHQ